MWIKENTGESGTTSIKIDTKNTTKIGGIRKPKKKRKSGGTIIT